MAAKRAKQRPAELRSAASPQELESTYKRIEIYKKVCWFSLGFFFLVTHAIIT